MSEVNEDMLEYYYQANISASGEVRERLSINDEMRIYFKNKNGDGVSGADKTEGAVYLTNDNLLSVPVIADIETFVDVPMDNIGEPETGYGNGWEVIPGGTINLKHINEQCDYKISISGTFISLDPGFLGTNVGIKALGPRGDYTGGTKFYPVGVSFGATPQIGFNLTIYGRFFKDESFKLQVSSTDATNLILTDCIIFLEPIKPIQ